MVTNKERGFTGHPRLQELLDAWFSPKGFESEAFYERLGVLFIKRYVPTGGALNAGGNKSVIRGWLADQGCASGRANGGTYAGTDPDCARKCVHEGEKIVLIDADHKRLLVVANKDAAVERVGDYVEISGDLDEQARTLHIDSLKLLEKGHSMCAVPPKRKQ